MTIIASLYINSLMCGLMVFSLMWSRVYSSNKLKDIIMPILYTLGYVFLEGLLSMSICLRKT